MKTKTWEEECLSRIRVFGGGSTALCVLWYLLEKIAFSDMVLKPAVVGNLRTPIGLSWFLRGLWQFPQISQVVLWGPDLTRTGDGLLKLWEEGLTEDHRVPGDFGWRIDPHIDRESIDILRKTVTLYDARQEKIREIAVADKAPSSRVKRNFAPVEIPDRVVLPSRGVFAPLVAKDPGHAWIEALNIVMNCGDVRVSRKGENQIHFFGVSLVFPVPNEHSIPREFDVTEADFDKYFEGFLAARRLEGVDYHYGERVFNYRGHDQVHELIARLRKSLDTKRATLAVLEVPDIEELEDAPCWAHTTFSVNLTSKTLSNFTVFRSHDMYGGWPVNILTLLELHRYVWTHLKDLGIALGYFCVTSENAQIYERHAEMALRKIKQFGVSLDNPARYNAFDTDPGGNFIFVPDHRTGFVKATMTNFAGDEILWEVESSDPTKLMHWIVAKHPWLTPQHVLYLGVEQEKLKRALRNGEDYVQG